MRASKKVKGAVLLTAGAALILGAPTVYADTNTGHNDGLLNGVQALNNVNLNIPINACGVGALLGGGKGTCTSAAGNDNGGASFGGGRGGAGGDEGSTSSSRNKGLLNGLQVGNNLTANVPVNACGVGALLATAKGNCSAKAGDGNGGSSSGRHGRGGPGGDAGNVRTGRNDGLLNGAQVLNNVTLNVPVNVCGVGLLLAAGRGDCVAKAGDGNGGNGFGGARGGRGGSAGDTNSFNNHGLLSGLQLLNNLDANIPVTVCGLAVLGAADCRVHVDAGNRNGGDSGHHHGWVGDKHSHHSHWTWHKHHNGDHESSVLPHTGAAGMAMIPFGLALIAGGAALRRRVASQR
ncbi:MAG TPA: hypothetical protein VE081_04570 [Sporichthyaceae bacterium]|nr:hypothetical protein [Sporichthyaceae bacterium]